MSSKSPFDIVMVWYQNDWGLYGRRNEYIARTLLKHKSVRNVLHIEPPLNLEPLCAHLRSISLDDNIHTNLKRLNLSNDKGVFIFTPHIINNLSPQKTAMYLQNQINKAIDSCKLDNILLWLNPPHPFVEFTLDMLKEKASLIVSDCVDDHRKYARTDAELNAIEKRYAKITAASDIVFSVSKTMRNEMAHYNQKSFYIPNAVSSDILNKPEKDIIPADMDHIKTPIIGYTGILSFRIDTNLLEFLAKKKPEWNIVLIGTSPNNNIRALLDLPNVHWLGAMKHEDLQDRLSRFDVCILPHDVNELTDKMNPLKIYEYLAHGKPVVSTKVAGIEMFHEDIEIADTKDEFVDAIEKILRKDSVNDRKKRIDRVRNHTWLHRVDEMMELILKTFDLKNNPAVTKVNKQYYELYRPEIRNCIPASAKKILDIGCASGRLGEVLKKEQDCIVIGIEYEPEIANEARYRLDDVFVGDAEDKIDNLPADYFDCIVLADVLEHLRNPEKVLKKLHNCLNKNGKIVASIPNVLHWSVIIPLLGGNWNYEDAGILDRTHLKFFTKRSILDMFIGSGYTVKNLQYTELDPKNLPIKSIIESLSAVSIDTAALVEESNYYQYILVAEKSVKIEKVTSIIILTYNQLEYTKKCLQSIEEYTSVPYELIIVDNGSTDGTPSFLKEYANAHNECKIILNKENLGFAGGNNKGITAAEGDYILLLNNDVVVTEHWLDRLIEHIESDINIGMIGPVTNYGPGPQLIENTGYGNNLEKMHTFAREYKEKNDGRIIDILRPLGFCLLIKRHVFDIIGILDERYDIGNYEDDDLCLRSRIAGFRNIIAQDVFIHHYGSMTFKGNSIDYDTTLLKNRKRFIEKWKGVVEEIDDLVYRFIMTHDEQINTLIEWGEEKFSKENFLSALKIFERVLQFDPKNSQALNNIGVMQWRLGNAAEAIKTFQIALKNNPKDTDALENLTQAVMETDELSLIYSDIMEIQINKLIELGEEYFSEENFPSALKYFEKVLRLDPKNSQALNNIGVMQWQLGDAPSSLMTFQKALSLDPKDSDAFNNLIQVAKETGRSDIINQYNNEKDNNLLTNFEAETELTKGKYCIWIVAIPDYIHNSAFDEIALGLKSAFRKLGFDVPVVTDPENISGTAIVLGCNLISQLQISELPKNIILYNLEQVQLDSPWMNNSYLELLKSHPVWDYSQINIKELNKIGISNVNHCGIGYEPELTKIPQIEEDIDVLFYGSINDRRKKILEKLKERGLNVVVLFGKYGKKRDEYIARAKIILNIHFYETKLFEIVRISYLLSNKKFIISESGSDFEFENIFDGGIVFSKLEDMVTTCQKYLNDKDLRGKTAEKGFEIFEKHSQSDFLRKAIDSSFL